MALSVEAVLGVSNASSSSGGMSGVGSFTVTSANKLLALVGIGESGADPAGNFTAISWNGQALSLVANSKGSDGSFEGTAIWQLNNPTPGTGTWTFTWNGGFVQMFAGFISFIDADATLRTPSVNNATSTNPNVTVVDSAAGDIVVSVCATDGSASATTQAGTIIAEAEDVNSDSDFNAQYQTAAGASTACTWTNATSSGWAASGVAVKVTGAAGGTIPRSMLLGAG